MFQERAQVGEVAHSVLFAQSNQHVHADKSDLSPLLLLTRTFSLSLIHRFSHSHNARAAPLPLGTPLVW
jgi:hypothetical protein